MYEPDRFRLCRGAADELIELIIEVMPSRYEEIDGTTIGFFLPEEGA